MREETDIAAPNSTAVLPVKLQLLIFGEKLCTLVLPSTFLTAWNEKINSNLGLKANFCSYTISCSCTHNYH